MTKLSTTRSVFCAMALLVSMAVSACAPSPAEARYSQPRQPVRPAANALIDPVTLARLTGVAKIRLSPGPYGLPDVKTTLADCRFPLRGALGWLRPARDVTMWDLMTYEQGADKATSVMTFAADYAALPENPLSVTRSGLAHCGATSTRATVSWADNRLPVIRFNDAPPPLRQARTGWHPSTCTLAVTSTHRGAGPDALTGALTCHSGAVRAAATDGLVPQERALLELAVARAKAALPLSAAIAGRFPSS
jgi:hypothetical protein